MSVLGGLDGMAGPVMSLGLVGLRDGEGRRMGFRDGVGLASGGGYRRVQVWAGDRETRPRELSRSGVRDVAAVVRRAGMGVSGVDLFVPVGDFFDREKADRAVSALCDAARFACELAALAGDGAGVLSTVLPRVGDGVGEGGGGDGGVDAGEGGVVARVRDEVVGVAEREGGVVADHGWPMVDGWAYGGGLGVGIDPAGVVLDGDGTESAGKALARVSQLGVLAGARVSDLTSAGRVEVGSGEGGLDVMGYFGALVTAKWMMGGGGSVVVDLRGIADGAGASGRVLGVFPPPV